MEADLGWSRVEITGAFSAGMGVAALAALPVGRWIDRHGARALMTLGSCLATALLLVWARGEGPPRLYAVLSLVGLALAGAPDAPRVRADGGLLGAGGRVLRRQLRDELGHHPPHPLSQRPRLLPDHGGGDDRLDGRHAAPRAARLCADRRALRPPGGHRRDLLRPGGFARPARAGGAPADARADGGHARRRQRHGDTGAGAGHPGDLRAAPLRLHQRGPRAL